MKTRQLTRLIQPTNTVALTIRITAMLVTTLAINSTRRTNERSRVPSMINW